MLTCDTCHDTGFALVGNDATYCLCAKGQRIKEARRAGPQKKKRRVVGKRWWTNREPGDDDD